MIAKGTNSIDGVYKGTTEIAEIRKGTTLVYENGVILEKEGVPPLTLNDSLKKNAKGYQIYGNSKQQILPDGYTQLEYIESTGTQYIDTGVAYDSTKKYTIFQDIECVGTQSVKGSGWNAGGAIFLNNTNEWYDGSLGNTGFSGNERVKVTIDIAKNSDTDTTYNWYSVNSKTTTTTTRSHTSLGAYSGNTGYPLFTSTVSGGSIGSQYNMSAKLYRASIAIDDTLVRNLIPAKNSSNVIGMYDLVSGNFYTNAGTGTFTAGATAPTPNAPIEIESVGDKTKNLWNSTLITGCMLFRNGDYNDYPGYVCNSTPVSVEAGQTYTLSATDYNDPSGAGFVFFNNGTFVSSSETTSLTVTIPSGVNQLYYNFRKQSSASSLSPSDITNVQLEKGSSATSYEPYGYNIPVNVSSTNLLPYPYILESGRYGGIDITINDDGSIKLNGTTTGVNATINTFRLKAGTYTISGNPSPDVNLWLRVVGSTTSAYYVRNYNGIKGTLTIAKDSDMYVYITISRGVTLNNVTIYPMVNKGTMNLEYSKYFTPVTTNIYLEEPLRKIGNYIDYIDLETQKVYRQIGNIKLDNNIPTSTATIRTNTIRLLLSLRGTPDKKTNNTLTSEILCTHGNGTPDYYYSNDEEGICELKNATMPYIIVSLALTKATTESGALQWLTNNNVYLNYILNTPTEESITLPDILLNKGTNIVNIDTSTTPSNMWIKYKGKIKTQLITSDNSIFITNDNANFIVKESE